MAVEKCPICGGRGYGVIITGPGGLDEYCCPYCGGKGLVDIQEGKRNGEETQDSI